RPRRAGVSGSRADGADSIVLAGAYEDDVFGEEEIIYSGSGGRDLQTGKQVTDQEMSGRNLALRRSQETGRPVRVFQLVAAATGECFRYEGLYRVVDHQLARGKAGFQVLLFRLLPVGAAEHSEAVLRPLNDRP
ncbi:MAG: YDG/SRA domain-containing protein, partial [Hymenobacter sp.]|nr:YDG/SRA domain-containing protein [Hymenobacter sp.]